MTATQVWEQSAVQEPTVLAVTGGHRMWYSGGWTTQAIGTAFRATGTTTWVKETLNPVMGLGSGGTAGGCGRPTVILVAGTYHMFFNTSAVGGGPNGTTVRHSTSADGITWANPTSVFTIPFGTVFGNYSVVIDAGTWYLIYETLNTDWKMGYATSPDGVTWTNQAGPLTSLSAGGSCGGPDLHGTSGAWTLYYHAAVLGFLPTTIYRATSTNLTTWTNVTEIVVRSLSWEVDQVADPFVITEGADLVMYYSGVDNNANTSKITRAIYTGQ